MILTISLTDTPLQLKTLLLSELSTVWNVSNGKSAMLVGCGYIDKLKYRYHKRASS